MLYAVVYASDTMDVKRPTRTNKGNTALLNKCTFNILKTIITINWTYIYIHSSDLYKWLSGQ